MSDSDRLPVITLLTDFGLADPYVGAIKGVILSICPSVQLVDLTHDISPQDVWGGGYVWASCFGSFPRGTVHVGVVDPGVGSERRAVAARIADQTFVCPDNGLLSWIVADHPVAEAFELRRAEYFLPQPSATFHGRDIFAPAAARIANGLSPAELGPPVQSLTLHDIPRPERVSEHELRGEVVHIDRYGNLVTNIGLAQCRELDNWDEQTAVVSVGRLNLHGLRRTYSDARHGEPLAYFGSLGKLDIAVNRGNAAEFFTISRGDKITLSSGGSSR